MDLGSRNQPSGPSFIRYHVIDMPERMDIEVAFPVEHLPKSDGSVSCGILPAGRYGTLNFTGLKYAVPANGQLISWISSQGKTMDSRQTDEGEAFAGRFETVLTDPVKESDPSKWVTEIAIKLSGG